MSSQKRNLPPGIESQIDSASVPNVRAPEEVHDDVPYRTPKDDFTKSELYRKWERRVVESDNDFVVVIAAASKSAVSGVGKTTLGITCARYFDASPPGFDAEQKATLNSDEFSRDLLTDDEEDRVPNQSAIIFDEAQGTLGDQGADARRSMAQSVMDISTAIATMRFRQNTAIIISQSTKWIDKRIDDLLDALILVQERDPVRGTVKAKVFETYYNDLSLSPTRYTEKMDEVTWPALPKSDPDYQYLHNLKQQSALNNIEEESEEEQSLPKDKQMEIAQELRDKGFTLVEIADSALIEYGRSWISEHTEAAGTDD